MAFLTIHNPNNRSLKKIAEKYRKFGIITRVRICETTYTAVPVEKEGLHGSLWSSNEGAPPSDQTVDDHSLAIIKVPKEPGCCTAVHHIVGLRRTPVLTALALLEDAKKLEGTHSSKDKHNIEPSTSRNFHLEKHHTKTCFCCRSSDHRNNCCTQ